MKKRKILIVEDYRDLQELLKSSLEHDGFDVVTADDGYEGYEIAKQERPDLIILDVILPAVDGFQVSRLIKSDMYLKNTPIIMMSGLRKEKADRERGIGSCAVEAYLFKPFKHQELLKMIKSLVIKK
ncbi:MAG: response regulator [Candidatus Omnitrophota bacterium]|nr:response regulator [Candidatus Omnitrophota bacterium]